MMHNTNKKRERERELRVNESNANNKTYFEVRAPSSTSPPSPRRISNPLGVPNSSLNQYNLHRGNTSGLPKTGVPNSTNTTKSTSPRGSKPQPQPLPKREQPTTQINLYQRGISTNKGFTTSDHKRPQTQFFHK